MRASRLVLGVALMLGLLAAPYAAGGQTPGHVYRVGIILHGGPYHVVVALSLRTVTTRSG